MEKKMEHMMERENISKEENKEILYENGRIYYRGSTERKIYFFLTLLMLILGIFYKTGLIG